MSAEIDASRALAAARPSSRHRRGAGGLRLQARLAHGARLARRHVRRDADDQGRRHGDARPARRSARPTRASASPRAARSRSRAGSLAWIRRDAGAVWLVEGPAQLTMHEDAREARRPAARSSTARTARPSGSTRRAARSSSPTRAPASRCTPDGSEDVYVLRGAARAGASADRASRGRAPHAEGGRHRRRARPRSRGTTGPAASRPPIPPPQPAPFGLGTVGARPPGRQGQAALLARRSSGSTCASRSITTSPSPRSTRPSSTRAPTRSKASSASARRRARCSSKFGVDRDGELVWGKVKESAAAKAQYESNVYQGSTEDPALLSWVGPGVYNARLYPIQAGAKRRVVTRYAEWLSRQGPKADRRLYVYPMAAEGARGVAAAHRGAPRLARSREGRRDARARRHERQDATAKNVVIQAFDFVPRADLAVELFDGGETEPGRVSRAARAHRGGHSDERGREVRGEGVERGAGLPPRAAPQRRRRPTRPPKGIDLAIVVDTSAATESGALAIARSLTSALLAHLGPDDRAALWAGDATLRPVSDGSGELVDVDADKRRDWLAGLASVERGGATDIGALLTEAASRLDPKRRGAVLYIGDGLPSVGELSPKSLRERMRAPAAGARASSRPASGSRANMALLDSIARGAPVESVGDAYGAARAALRLLEAAQRPAWVGAIRRSRAGRRARAAARAAAGRRRRERARRGTRLAASRPPSVDAEERRDRRSRGRSRSCTHRRLRAISAVAGDRAACRSCSTKARGARRSSTSGGATALVSPYTSLYVPTAREAAQRTRSSTEALAEARAEAIERRRWWRPWSHSRPSDGRRAEPAERRPPTTRRAAPARAPRAKRARWATRTPKTTGQALRRPGSAGQPGPAHRAPGRAPRGAGVRHDRPPQRRRRRRSERARRRRGVATTSLGNDPLLARAATCGATRSATRSAPAASASPASAKAAAVAAKASASATSARSATAPAPAPARASATATAASAARTSAKRADAPPGRDAGQRSPPAGGHPAHRPPELRPLPPLLRERPAQQPEPPGARRGEVRHRPRRRGLRRRRRRLATCPDQGVVVVRRPRLRQPVVPAARGRHRHGRLPDHVQRPATAPVARRARARRARRSPRRDRPDRRSSATRRARAAPPPSCRSPSGASSGASGSRGAEHRRRRARRLPPRARGLRGADLARAHDAAPPDGGPAARGARRASRSGSRSSSRPAADVVYRAIVVRVQNVARAPRAAQRARARVGRSRPARRHAREGEDARPTGSPCSARRRLKWPDDLELGLRVLDAYEDAGDDARRARVGAAPASPRRRDRARVDERRRVLPAPRRTRETRRRRRARSRSRRVARSASSSSSRRRIRPRDGASAISSARTAGTTRRSAST